MSVWPRPAPVEVKPVVVPQPIKVSYGPPKAKVQYGGSKSSSTGAYVVKAKSGQVYNPSPASAYSVKKIQNDQSSAIPAAAANMDETSAQLVKSEVGMLSALSTPSDRSSTTNSTPRSDSFTVPSTPESGER